MQSLTGSVGLVGLVVAGPAGAGGALVGIEVGADVAESPEHPASANSSVDNTATKSRFMISLPRASQKRSLISLEECGH